MNLRSARIPVVALGLIPLSGLAEDVSPKPPAAIVREDDFDEQAIAARRTFVNNCLICHSEEMTSRQRLTPKQWKAEVEKMVGWGAPVPPAEAPGLIDALAALYPDTAPSASLATITPAEVATLDRQDEPVATPDANPTRGAALYAAQCATCHGADARGADLGPNLVEKPVLQRADEYTQVMRHGRRRMPGFAATVGPAQEADILAWLRARR